MSFLRAQIAKPSLTLLLTGLLALLSPLSPIDPWGLFSPRKMAAMVFALTFIQIFGTVLSRFLDARSGAILTGFFGGLVSSTATTATLARKSRAGTMNDSYGEVVVFLSATGAMLLEGAALVYMGAGAVRLSTVVVFLGPMVATVFLVLFFSRKLVDGTTAKHNLEFKVMPILKLSALIISLLFLSKILEKILGSLGLIAITFLVSLFEIHGSVITNIQLLEDHVISSTLLDSLLAISILASYLSKVFLISTLGSKRLKLLSVKITALLLSALFLSWITSINI